jgi:acetyl-CoA acyltransferase 1
MESDELLLSFFNAVVPELQINPALVEDITIGNVVAPGIAYIGRAAALAAGFPESTACQIVNRFCSSGLMAVSIIANNIRNNEIEVGLAVGFESMSAT